LSNSKTSAVRVFSACDVINRSGGSLATGVNMVHASWMCYCTGNCWYM